MCQFSRWLITLIKILPFQCDPGVGVDRFFHALYTQNTTRMVMLLGSACSEVTESLAKVVPHWNIVQVSFGSTSPALSDRQEFPFFYRTVATDSSHNPARIAFIRKFGWDTVTTFSQNEEVHSLAVNDLVTELESANISCAATITFAETDFKEQLLLLRVSLFLFIYLVSHTTTVFSFHFCIICSLFTGTGYKDNHRKFFTRIGTENLLWGIQIENVRRWLCMDSTWEYANNMVAKCRW